jgi:starvation-inducible DNA-binding protein
MPRSMTTNGRTAVTSIDIPENTRKRMVDLLNQHLANSFDLLSQTKQAHWNVKGEHFYTLHEFFDEAAEVLEKHVDDLAERATSLGGIAMGTARMAAASSKIPEFPEAFAGMECVEALVERWAKQAASVRKAIDESDKAGDMGTSDLFTEIVRDLDKYLWFLEAHLQTEDPARPR